MTSNPFLDILRDYERGSSGASLPVAGDPFGDILSEAGEIAKRKKAEEQEKILGPSEQTQFIIPADKEAVDEPNPTPPKPPVYEDARPPVVRMLGQAARAGREFLGGLGSGIGRSLPEMAAGATEAVAQNIRRGLSGGLDEPIREFENKVRARAGLEEVDSYPWPGQREAVAGAVEKNIAKPLRSLADLTPEYQPEIPTVGAIQSSEDVPAFAAGQFGQGLATALPMFLANAVGGTPAAVIAGYGLNSGDVFNELIDNGIPAKEASELTGILSVPVTALDMVGLQSILGGGGATAKKGVAKWLLDRAVGAAGEGVTEMGQEAIQGGATSYVTNQPVLSLENLDRILTAGAGGALVGGALAQGEPSQVQPQPTVQPPVRGRRVSTLAPGFEEMPPTVPEPPQTLPETWQGPSLADLPVLRSPEEVRLDVLRAQGVPDIAGDTPEGRAAVADEMARKQAEADAALLERVWAEREAKAAKPPDVWTGEPLSLGDIPTKTETDVRMDILGAAGRQNVFGEILDSAKKREPAPNVPVDVAGPAPGGGFPRGQRTTVPPAQAPNVPIDARGPALAPEGAVPGYPRGSRNVVPEDEGGTPTPASQTLGRVLQAVEDKSKPTPPAEERLVQDRKAPKGLIELPTDAIQESGLRRQAEDEARAAAIAGREVRADGPLAPYRAQMDDLRTKLKHSYDEGRVHLRDVRSSEPDAQFAASVGDGIHVRDIDPNHPNTLIRIYQIHNGEIVGFADGVDGQTKMIVGGEPMGSPVSARPLYTKMRELLEPDETLTWAGELARRRELARLEREAGDAGRRSEADRADDSTPEGPSVPRGRVGEGPSPALPAGAGPSVISPEPAAAAEEAPGDNSGIRAGVPAVQAGPEGGSRGVEAAPAEQLERRQYTDKERLEMLDYYAEQLKKGVLEQGGMTRDPNERANVYGVDPIQARWGAVSRKSVVPGLEDEGISRAEIGAIRNRIRRGTATPADVEWIDSRLEEVEGRDAESEQRVAESFDPTNIEELPDREMTPEEKSEADKYAIARPGQRGLPGIGEDVPAIAERRTNEEVIEPALLKPGQLYFNGDLAEYTGKTQRLHGGIFHEIRFLEGARAGETRLTQQRAPQQTSMFGGEMLQGVEAKTTEGREGEGPLFTQEAEARAKKEREAQGGLFSEQKKRGLIQTSDGFKWGEGMPPNLTEQTFPTRDAAIKAARDYEREIGFPLKPLDEELRRKDRLAIGELVEKNRPGLRERVAKVFPGVKIEETPEGFSFNLKNGGRVVINQKGEIALSPMAAVAGYGKSVLADVASGKKRVLGVTRSFGPDIIVDLVDKGVLPHESVHVFMDYFATEKEQGLIRAEFEKLAEKEGRSWHETAADGYQHWFYDRWFDGKAPSSTVAKFFRNIREFFKRMYRALFPNHKSVFETIRSGEYLERKRSDKSQFRYAAVEDGQPLFAIKPTAKSIEKMSPNEQDRYRRALGFGEKSRRESAITGRDIYSSERYPESVKVAVELPDGTMFYDEIKGLNRGHALARARVNWEGDNVRAATPEEIERWDDLTEDPGERYAVSGGRLTIPDEVWQDKVLRRVQDKMLRLKRMEEAVGKQGGTVAEAGKTYRAETLFHGRTEERIREEENDLVDPLIDKMIRLKVTPEKLDDYLQILHEKDRDVLIAKRGGGPKGSGLSPAESARIKQELSAEFGAFNNNGVIPSLEPLAQMVRKIREEVLRVKVDGELITSEEAQGWKDTFGPNYIPLKGTDAAVGEMASPRGAGYSVKGRESRSATGRSTKAKTPTAYLIHDLYSSVIRAERDKIGRTLYKFVQDNPDLEWEIDKEHKKPEKKDGKIVMVPDMAAYQNDFHVKIKGIEHRITIGDERVLRAMKNLEPEQLGSVMKVLSTANRYFSMMQTVGNPGFLLDNLTRDYGSSIANASAEQGMKIAKKAANPKNVAKAIRGVWQHTRGTATNNEWAKWAKRFARAGGQTGFYDMKSVEDIAKGIENKFKATGMSPKAVSRRVAGSVFRLITDANKAVENGIRLSMFRTMVEAGHTEEQAAYVSKNLTIDFNRKGELGPKMNALWAFSQVGFQGTKRLYDVAVANKTGRKIAMGFVGAGFVMDTLARAMSGDDDDDGINDYDQIPEYVKERKIVIPGTNGTFNLPYGFNVFYSLGRNMSSVAGGAKGGGKATVDTVKSFLSLIDFFGFGGSISQAIMPTMADPIVQIGENKSAFGGPIYPERRKGDFRPESKMAFKNVSPLAKTVAEGASKLTGGDDVRGGKIDVSPEILEHLAAFITGGLGRFAGHTATTAASLVKGEAPEPSTTPFVRSFVYSPHASEQSRRFYEYSDELERLASNRKDYLEAGAREKAKELAGGVLKVKGVFDSADRELKRLRTVRDRADKQKRDTKMIEASIEAKYKRANKAMAEMRKRLGLPAVK